MVLRSALRTRSTTRKTSQALIDGTYSPTDAKSLVMSILDSEINLHKLRNLRAHVQTEQSDATELRSIEDLENTRAELDGLLQKAKDEGLRIRLQSVVDVEIDEYPASERA